MHLLALFRSSWEKSLCPSFALVFIGLCFFSWRRVSRLYLWASHPLSDVCFANIHSQLLCCLCIESMVSLTGQKRLHLRWSRLFLVSFAALAQSDRLLPNRRDRKSTRLNSSHANISYAVFCLKKKHTLKFRSLHFIYIHQLRYTTN